MPFTPFISSFDQRMGTSACALPRGAQQVRCISSGHWMANKVHHVAIDFADHIRNFFGHAHLKQSSSPPKKPPLSLKRRLLLPTRSPGRRCLNLEACPEFCAEAPTVATGGKGVVVCRAPIALHYRGEGGLRSAGHAIGTKTPCIWPPSR